MSGRTYLNVSKHVERMKNVSMTSRMVRRQLKTDFILLEKRMGSARMLMRIPIEPITVWSTPSTHQEISTYLDH